MTTSRKRYAIVGMGSRTGMFAEAILGKNRDRCELVGLCDLNQTRINYYNRRFQQQFGGAPVPSYRAGDYDSMVREQKPSVVIVTTIDRTHHEYIIRAMELDCGVITEKPMTIDIDKCRAIFDAIARTGRTLRVTFNYRYSPLRTAVKELLMKGAIGVVKLVHFEWLLDTRHGADYLRTLRVTFNYRYSPLRTAVKELLMKGAIGVVKLVHFEWLLDTRHGADYLRRWHR